MSLPSPSFAAFKYDHPDPHVPRIAVPGFWFVFILLGMASYSFFGEAGIVPVVILGFLVSWKWPRKQIYLGRRYVVCGRTIVYYRNVRKMALRPGVLTLQWGDKQSFTLEETRFPTNARKDHKIKANKAAKFRKVSGKIIEHVLAEAPAVELAGIQRTARPQQAQEAATA